jgi:hypothetical protein
VALTDRERETLLGLFEEADGSQRVTIEQRTDPETRVTWWRVTFEVYPESPSHAGPSRGEWSPDLDAACYTAGEGL